MGIVQGVGFRPYVYNQANRYSIKGWVSNQGSALIMDIVGEALHIRNFLLHIVNNPPTLAKIEKVEAILKEYVKYETFEIIKSSVGNNEIKFISPDVGMCPDCLKDITDRNNQRYHYPFTNCTSCGPRYSIIKKLPYDRCNTTMDNFKMCPTCEQEYHNPTDRRFHAQPNGCPNCGPSLELLATDGKTITKKHSIREVIRLIKEGKIIAVKGIGGFHLVCDAENNQSIEVLRVRKKRPHKPFAIMVKDIETARTLCYMSKKEEEVLLSNKRPIVILKKKYNSLLSENIAPNTSKIGLMLPYTPLHYSLFQENIKCLIMTSGNLSGEPIQYENPAAIEKLKDIVDYFLVHNRDINIPVEDSVVKVLNEKEIIIRSARGYTPYIIDIKAKNKVLALGAQQKNTFCISQNGYVYLSQYLGDLQDYNAYSTYKKAINNLLSILNNTPEIIAYDLHPSYTTSQPFRFKDLIKIPVQHHHAHMVSCMVEHNLNEPVIGVVFDGTGFGLDGNIWGGEFFIGDRAFITRVGHLKYVTIQGGDMAIKEPWRIATSYLHAIKYNNDNIQEWVSNEKVEIVKQAIDKNINCYQTSSVGRLFDCVSSILNVCQTITYDAQAAIELEEILDPSITETYEVHVNEESGLYIIDYTNILTGIIKDVNQGVTTSTIASKFHNTLINATIELISIINQCYGINKVVLSGGVFENRYLLSNIISKLTERNIKVYYHKVIPTNDSGISIGQLAIADTYKGVGKNVFGSSR